ncbi:MAG: hypothetical protein IKA77_02550 [Clostridia bacterium]|nr:hypothetical protein [Clostridia bacterium]
MLTIINVISIVLAVVTVVWTALSLWKLFKLNKLFNEGKVIARLHKRSKWPYFGLAFLGVCFIADVLIISLIGYYAIAASFMVIIVALMVLFIFMLRLKCAVLETGIIVPYKFIDWSHLFDYSVNKDMNTIFFCGNKQGFDTVFAATTRLEFADEDLDALITILNNHKLNK